MKGLKYICFMASVLPYSASAMELPQENGLPFSGRNAIHTNQKKPPKNKGKRKIEEDKENKKRGEENLREVSSKRQKFSSEEITNNNNESFVQSNLRNVIEKIEESHNTADWVGIYKSFISFQELNYDELEWAALAQKLKAYSWPSQKTWKEVVGGHLFFPKETIEWEGNIFESFHLRRIDMIWSFAVGVKFNHALSKYYLANVLEKIRSNYTDAPRPLFFKKLYTEAFGDLKKSVDNSDACYVIGDNYGDYPYLSTTYVDEKKDRDASNSKKAIEWHKKGKDLKNKFQILEIKEAAPAIYPSPTGKEYLTLAREGYTSAYINALLLTDDPHLREEINKEALGKGYKYFLPNIKSSYKDKEKLEETREAYRKAGRNNVSYAYIMLGSTYVGEMLYQFKLDRIDLKKISSQDINKAIEAFTAAGTLKNPEGWEYLSTLYQELYEQKVIKKKVYRDKILSSLEEGVKLGSANCYHKSQRYLPQKAVDWFVENYGYPPQMGLRENIEVFINKKY